MVQRWGRAEIFRGVAIAAIVTVVLIITALIDRGYARFVDESNGPSLSVPTPEPSVEANLGDLDLTGKTPEEIVAILEQQQTSLLDEDFTRSFDVSAVINPDHSVTITEEIVQVFRGQRRGIERYLPIETNRGTNMVRSIEVGVSAGTPGTFSVFDIEGGLNVRIGDPDRYITNAHTYRLTYVLEDVLDTSTGSAIIRLDAINSWRQNIASMTYRVSGPTKPLDADCYLGAFGSDERCPTIDVSGNEASFAPGRVLTSGEAFTVELSFPTSAFAATASVTPRPKPVLPAVIVALAVFLAVAAGYVITRIRERRSLAQLASAVTLTFEGPMQTGLANRMIRGSSLPPPTTPPMSLDASLPADASLGAPVEFIPPLQLDPASMLRLRDLNRVDIPLLLSSTLVDLAADGVIALERRGDGDEWLVRRIPQAPRGVTPYEELLLRALLDDTESSLLGERAAEVGRVIPSFVGALDAHLRQLGLLRAAHIGFSASGRAGVLANAFIAIVSMAIASLVFIGILSQVSSPLGLGTGFAVVVGGGLLVSALLRDRRRSSKYAARGLGAVHRVSGFERFFRDSESIHARAAGNLGLFREYMGYAVAFGHLDNWVAAMPEQVAGSLVSAVPMAQLGLIGHHAMWRTASNNYAASVRPSSSSGGGGFSGGGFSGGGSGGGGGGSW